MKISLERALYIIKHVNPADRLFQLMSLDGLDFGPHSACFAISHNNFKWVSKEMCLIPDAPESSLNYSVSAELYYKQVQENLNPSNENNDLLFYRYLGGHTSGSARELHDALKQQIISSVPVYTSADQAKLLYLLVITTFSEEPEKDLEVFLARLQKVSASTGISTTDIINAIFISFKDVNADRTALNQLSQILPLLADLSYAPPETLLTLLPKMSLLLHANNDTLIMMLKRHTALLGNENESRRFVSLINLLTDTMSGFTENTPEKKQFINILALLADELTPADVTTLSTALHGLTQSHRTAILSLLSTISIDKSTNLSSFNLVNLKQIMVKLTENTMMSTDDIGILLSDELPGIKIGEKDDEPTTYTIADATKEYLKDHSPTAGLAGLKSIPFIGSSISTLEGVIDSVAQISDDTLFPKLNDFESLLNRVTSTIRKMVSNDTIINMMPTEEERELVRQYLKTSSMKVYIPFIFLKRFNKILKSAVQQLQTGQQRLDNFLITALDRVPMKDSDPFGTTIQHYNNHYEAAKLLTNTLLKIKNRNYPDYIQCVAILNDPTTWNQVGLGNMALLLEGLGNPVSAQLKTVLSTLSSITEPPTADQMRAAIKDLNLLTQSKNDLGDKDYLVLLDKAVRHNLTQTTAFPLTALIGFKQGSMTEIDSQQADALFKSVLRIIKISPPDNPEILESLIDKTTLLINRHVKEMPNIVSFLTTELDAIATAADHREALKAGSVYDTSSNRDVNWWFLLTMFSTIISAITLLWVMLCSYWNPPAPVPPAVDETPEALSDTLKNYTESLDVIEKGFSRHHEEHSEIAHLFTFWPYPSLKTFTGFFTGEKHADKLTALETQKQDIAAQLATKTGELDNVKTRLAESLIKLRAYQTLIASQAKAYPELLDALVTLVTNSVADPLLECKALEAESIQLEAECKRLTDVMEKTAADYDNALILSTQHLKAGIQSFDQDPYKRRTKDQVLQHQRTTERVEDVIREMSDLLQNESFSPADQHALARQFMYLNVIGTDTEYPLVVGDKRCENLALASREELCDLSKAIITKLHASPGPLEDETLTLQLLAVMREAYYRSTGIFPYSTQMLSVLTSLNHPGNLMLQINTGEGKSTTTALLAGIQCARGGMINERKNKPRTQIICTGNATLVEQGYAETHHFFNEFLKVPSSVINLVQPDGEKTSASSNTLAIGGITYTTVQALSFYKQRAKREGKSFTQDDKGNALEIDCTFDECDTAFLDDYTQLSLVAPIEGSEATAENPHAWIYPLVNQFVVEDSIHDSLRDFIENHPLTTTSQRLQLLSIPDSKLEQWEDAANDVLDYKEGLDFVVIEEEKREINGIERIMSIVTPLNRSTVPQRGSSFPNYRHEMLQAKIQSEAPDKYFPIDPEVDVVDQESVKSLIDSLAHQGRIIGLSGTLGNIDELRELESTYHVQAIKIPPHQKNRRDTSTPALLGETLKKQDNDLVQIIEKGGDQPLMVVCKTILEVEELYRKLKKKYPQRIQQITGKESEADITQRKDRAGIPGMITIGTPLMGRGVDFKTSHPQGYHLHQRFIDAQRETEQVMGRVARNGQLGKYSASYVIDGVPFQYGFSYFGVDVTAAMQQLKEQQKKITQDAARVRHYIQAFDAIQQVTLQQFDACKQQLLETCKGSREQLENSLSIMRTALIEKLDSAWNNNLPKGDNSNPYLNEPGTLNHALKTFESRLIPALWKETHSALLEMDRNPDDSRLTWLADIKQALNARKLTVKREKKQATTHVKQVHQQLQSALDPAAAILFYSGSTLKPEEIERLKNASDKIQISSMFKHVNNIIGSQDIAFDEDKTTADNLLTVINTIGRSFNTLSIEQQYRLYPTAAQAIEYCRKPVFAECNDRLDNSITVLEQQVKESLRNVLATELEKRLGWAKPGNNGMDYMFERVNVRNAAEGLYTLASELRNPAARPSLINLYKRLYHYKLLFKDELANYAPWGHEDIRAVIDDVLGHINELKNIELVDDVAFQNARDEVLYSLYFKRFNAQIEKIGKTYPTNIEWKTIAEKIKSIQKHKTLSVFHDLKHYLKQNTDFKLNASKNYFFGSAKAAYFPVQDLLNELEADKFKIQQEVPEFSRDRNYLATKAIELTDLFGKENRGTIKSLTITPRHSGIGEYFELRIEGAEYPEAFDQDDVVRYTSNVAQLKKDTRRLEAIRAEQKHTVTCHYDLLHQLKELKPANAQTIPSNFSPYSQAITNLNAAIQDWLAIKENTPFSYLRSYFNQYPFSIEIEQQLNDLITEVRLGRESISEQAELVSQDLVFLNKTIEEKSLMDESVIIKQFQSIDELLTYEDTLRERVRLQGEEEKSSSIPKAAGS